jgi:2'-5' RNA ligase
VIWLGLEDKGELGHLAGHIEKECRQLGIDPDNKSFRPHITLARARSSNPTTVSQLPDLTLHAELPNWPVGAIALMKSELTPRGPIYTRLNEWRLGG